jgi:hypothetical protein
VRGSRGAADPVGTPGGRHRGARSGDAVDVGLHRATRPRGPVALADLRPLAGADAEELRALVDADRDGDAPEDPWEPRT